jgi:hypothetical protein
VSSNASLPLPSPVSGIIKVKEIYYAKEDKTYVYHVEYEGSNTYQGSKESVIEQFKKEMFDIHNFHEESPDKDHIVEEIIITSIVEKESTTILKEAKYRYMCCRSKLLGK